MTLNLKRSNGRSGRRAGRGETRSDASATLPWFDFHPPFLAQQSIVCTPLLAKQNIDPLSLLAQQLAAFGPAACVLHPVLSRADDTGDAGRLDLISHNVSIRKSTPPQNSQLAVLMSIGRQYVNMFVGELTFSNHFHDEMV